MTRWNAAPKPSHTATGSSARLSTRTPADVDALLKELGAEGWEVWQLDGSILRLKREIPDGGFHPD